MATFGKVLQWIAIGYGVVVVATAAIVAIALRQPADDANFAGVWLLVVTMPLSMLVTAITLQTDLQGWPFMLVLIATGLVQAALVWFLGRVVRNRAEPAPTP